MKGNDFTLGGSNLNFDPQANVTVTVYNSIEESLCQRLKDVLTVKVSWYTTDPYRLCYFKYIKATWPLY